MLANNMNYLHFGIMDVHGNKVSAGAAFKYRGFIISMSTVFNSPSIAVFTDSDDQLQIDVVHTANSVEAAINWCNSQKD